jgi:hypothetical protein
MLSILGLPRRFKHDSHKGLAGGVKKKTEKPTEAKKKKGR